ncbi:response regulator transcription factor [Metabacillus litoralis]|uniref:Response regulator transcription factor n=1 Tax=Metabacillus litoralis TaxID=152268 RepID=A0A5C6W368_9BACI|nr:response regulator transcription factor [Metabacillus litoralis]TXC91841.1 response regulator transcription factor [Metabacillus litoralis]
MEDKRILIVDDEKAIVKMLETVLRKEGFQLINKAFCIKDALQILQNHTVDIIILDVMLPDQSGFDALPKIRQLSQAYVLFLTAKTSDLDVLTGFAIGGDDYVTKPFNPLEIVARLKAFLRRTTKMTQLQEYAITKYDFGRFILFSESGELFVENQPVLCPAQVYMLLLYFCKHPNKILSKTELLEAVWGFDHYGDDNTVAVHIRRIRERIEQDPSNPKLLITVRGLGYKLVRTS